MLSDCLYFVCQYTSNRSFKIRLRHKSEMYFHCVLLKRTFANLVNNCHRVREVRGCSYLYVLFVCDDVVCDVVVLQLRYRGYAVAFRADTRLQRTILQSWRAALKNELRRNITLDNICELLLENRRSNLVRMVFIAWSVWISKNRHLRARRDQIADQVRLRLLHGVLKRWIVRTEHRRTLQKHGERIQMLHLRHVGRAALHRLAEYAHHRQCVAKCHSAARHHFNRCVVTAMVISCDCRDCD